MRERPSAPRRAVTLRLTSPGDIAAAFASVSSIYMYGLHHGDEQVLCVRVRSAHGAAVAPARCTSTTHVHVARQVGEPAGRRRTALRLVLRAVQKAAGRRTRSK